MKKHEITQEMVKDVIDYVPETGKLYWKERKPEYTKAGNKGSTANAKGITKRLAGKEAFTAVDDHGYKQGWILRYKTVAHRVIWLWMTGEWPEEVDHQNGIRDDNRWENLREVDSQNNKRNQRMNSKNTSGKMGVSWDITRSRWYVHIKIDGKLKFLGRFDDFEEACAARDAADIKYGFHPNHGSEVVVKYNQK